MENIFQFFEQFYIPSIKPLDIFEIFLIIVLIYQIQKSLKNTRAWVIAKGIFILAIIYLCSSILGLSVIETLFQGAISLSVLAAIILFEPEIKKFLEELGTKKPKDIIHWINTKEPLDNKRYSEKTIKEILDACNVMSEAKTGALIIMEQDSILNEYINTGIRVNADITSQLLINIFEHNTPLHDGAVIIRKNKIVSATCYLPLSDNSKINKKLGTRHRAGIGLSEITDAIVIIVSEETGQISFVKDGTLKHGVSLDTLHNLLNSYQEKKIESDKINLIKKKKETLKHNFGSKILSLLFGIFIWVVIINSQNPLDTKKFTIPVEIQNETALSNVGKTYEIEKGSNVEVKVTAPRNVLDKLESKDIKAYADLNKLSYTYAVPIEAKIISNASNQCSINTNNATMQLKLDEMVELTLDLQLESYGNCRNGYYLTELSSNTKEIRIQGSESVLKTIDKVIAKVPINNEKEDFTLTRTIEIYDKNGAKLNNDDFVLSASEVIVNGTILPLKNIPIKINLTNENSDEYKLISIESDLKNLSVAGTREDLESFDGITIDLDMKNEQISENLIKTLNLSDYLPERIYLADNNKRINISMKYEISVTKEFEISTNDIQIENLNDDFKCIFKNDIFKLNFKGNEDDINQLNMKNLKFSIDLNKLNKGNYNLPIKIQNLPENITLISDGIISLEIKR